MNLMLGDCLERMKEIPPASVDMVLCDLPYGTTACKWDAVIPFGPLWEQYRRICTGPIVLTANHPFTSVMLLSNLAGFCYSLVWQKTRNSHPFFAKVRPLPQHEDILVFGNAKKYNPQMVPSENTFKRNSRAGGKLRGDSPSQKWDGVSTEHNERYPHSVITISNASREVGLHPTQKPVALMEYLIRTYTNAGDVVLDNTMGSGTTGVACANTGRDFIGIERDPEYFAIAEKRIREAELNTY